MEESTAERPKGSADSPIGAEGMSSPRDLDEFHDFYQRWKSQIFGFFLLVGGDKEKAELLTAQTFVSYFRCGDFIGHHHQSHIPVALLRFASDLAGIQCGQHRGASSVGLTAALLALPLKERAVFTLISILRVRPSIAAVALRLRSGQLADYWTRAALRLRSSWLRSLELPVRAHAIQQLEQHCIADSSWRGLPS